MLRYLLLIVGNGEFHGGFGLPVPFGPDLSLEVVGGAPGGPSDNDPPVLSRVFLQPAVVDVTQTARTVFVEFDIADPGSGFGFGQFDLGAVGRSISIETEHLVAGDLFSGTYRVPVPVARGTDPGAYAVDNIALRDESFEFEFDVPIPTNSSVQLTVINTGLVDTNAPALLAFSLSLSFDPPVVDISQQPGILRLEAGFSDPGSGKSSASIDIFDGNDQFLARINLFNGLITSGDVYNGVFEAQYEIPTNAAPGIYRVELGMFDVAGNFATYLRDPHASRDDERAFPPGIGSTFEVVTQPVPDQTAPGLVSASPLNIDVTGGPQQATLSARFTDPGSGVRRLRLLARDPSRRLIAQQDFDRADAARFIGNDPEFEWTLDFPPHSLPGSWTWYAYLLDEAGHTARTADQPFPVTAATGTTSQLWTEWAVLHGVSTFDGNPDLDDWPNGLERIFGGSVNQRDPLFLPQADGYAQTTWFPIFAPDLDAEVNGDGVEFFMPGKSGRFRLRAWGGEEPDRLQARPVELEPGRRLRIPPFDGARGHLRWELDPSP